MHRARAGRAGLASIVLAAAAAVAAIAFYTAVPGRGRTSPVASGFDPRATGPARIVSLMPQVTELIVALGESRRLVGRITDERDASLHHLPSVGDPVQPNIEAIVQLEPDLVIVWDAGLATERLRSLFGESTLWATRSERIEDLWVNLAHVSGLLGRERAADSLLATLRGGLAEVGRRLPERPRPTAVYLLWEDPPMVAGPGSFIHELIEIAGGTNAFFDAPVPWAPVSLESLVSRDADVVLWPRREEDPTPLHERPGWRLVPAVARGDVVVVDRDLFERPGVRLVTAARVLAAALYPALDSTRYSSESEEER